MRIWIKLNTNEVEKKSFYSEWTTAIARSSESYEKLWLDSCIRFKAIQICSQVTTQIIQTPSSLGEHLSQRQFSAMKLKLRTEFVSTQTPEAQHFVHFVFVVICFYLTFLQLIFYVSHFKWSNCVFHPNYDPLKAFSISNFVCLLSTLFTCIWSSVIVDDILRWNLVRRRFD